MSARHQTNNSNLCQPGVTTALTGAKRFCAMIIEGKTLPEENGRRAYPLTLREVTVNHFVVRVTTPDNPFKPHKHEQQELWFILEGEAVLSLDGDDHVVEAGDLIELTPWVEHGLRTDGCVTWICIG